jgi:hypothetical protein
MSVEEFHNHSDDDYPRWIADHHRGYVLNIQRTCNPRDARLHLGPAILSARAAVK